MAYLLHERKSFYTSTTLSFDGRMGHQK